MGRSGGWLARAERLVEKTDCVEKGYLLLPAVHRLAAAGDVNGARAAAAEAAAYGDRFGDPDLSAFGRCLEGRVLLRQGQVARGLALLDEAMVAVTAGGLGPVPTGLIYCTAIACCSQLYVMDRAREWTAALAGWCAAQPDLVPFSGTCLVHRAELMQLGGSWPEAIDEARRASERVSRRADWQATADAYYQQAEVHRLRGDFAAAERGYRSASELGREAQPGLALLGLAQGRAADAHQRDSRGAHGEQGSPAPRPPAARRRRDSARRPATSPRPAAPPSELAEIAADFGTEVLGAMAAHAQGAVELAEGRPDAALEPLRRAFRVWHAVGAPYIGARLRVLIARACRALGDRDTAALELDCARRVFEQLGAAPDLAALDARGARRGSRRAGRALAARAGGPAPGRRRQDQQGDREAAVPERKDRSIATSATSSRRPTSRRAPRATAFAYQHGLVLIS